MSFQFPGSLVTDSQRLRFLLEVVSKYQSEGGYLRRLVADGKKREDKLQRDVEKWKKRYEKVKEKYRKEKQDNNRLISQIEKLLKTNSRYQVALFDHGNFKAKDNQTTKLKGGQMGHQDTNREGFNFNRESLPKVHLFVKTCQACGNDLTRVKATRSRLLIDVKIDPRITKLLVTSERQWCPVCHKEVRTKHPQSLPFTEYGINTFIIVLLLRFGSGLTFGKIAQVLNFSFGLDISKSEIASLLFKAKIYLKDNYESLKEAARKREITYQDETGWQVRGRSAWMWIMATKAETVYFAAESRGKGIAKDNFQDSKSYAMTDGLASYQDVIPKERHLYCWAHLLRFAYEETIKSKKNSDGAKLRDKLVEIYHLKKNNPGWDSKQLENVLQTELSKILALFSKERSFQNIQERVKDQKEGLIKAILLTPDGTNNLAERELRPLVISRKISFGSDTFSGMETTAMLASIIQTTFRQKKKPLPTLKRYFLEGVKKTYPKYLQASFVDSS